MLSVNTPSHVCFALVAATVNRKHTAFMNNLSILNSNNHSNGVSLSSHHVANSKNVKKAYPEINICDTLNGMRRDGGLVGFPGRRRSFLRKAFVDSEHR